MNLFAPYRRFISGLSVMMVLPSCSTLQTGDSLSKADIAYVKSLGILDSNEKIVLFETHAGWFNSKRIAGSYFTEKRIASYWIDKRNKRKTSINAAYYSDIDTITTTDLSNSLTMASYLSIKKTNGQEFRVFISQDSAKTCLFFNRAISEWRKRRQPTP